MTEEDMRRTRSGVEALARAVQHDVAALEPLIEREMALYISLPDDKRREVDDRLFVLAGLPADGRTVAHVMRAADQLGVERSNVYRLLKRVEELGPVGGLVPGRRARERASAAKDGFGEPIDGWIYDLLKEQPDASIAEIRRMIASRMLIMPHSGDGVELPTAPASSALQRRVHELRRRGTSQNGVVVAVGAALLVDYCPVHLLLADPSDPSLRLASMVVIVDTATSIVLGAGFFLKDDVAGGLARAVDHMEGDVLPSLSGRGLIFAKRLERIRWIVSPDLIEAAGRAARIADALDPAVRFDGEHGGSGLPGTEMHRRLGNSLGLVRFKPRSEGLKRASYPRPVAFEAGERMLIHEVRQRNERLIETMRGTATELPPSRTDRPTEPWLSAVSAIFEPVRRRSTDRGRP